MSQWEEDFPDDEMMGSPKPAAPPANSTSEGPLQENEAESSAVSTNEPDEDDEGKITSAAKPSIVVPEQFIPENAVATKENAVATKEVELERAPVIEELKEEVPKEELKAEAPIGKLKEEPAIAKLDQVPKLMNETTGNKIATSGDIINEQESRLEAELKQLLIDIRRVGKDGEPHVTFGELFDDHQVANYYEALVGTLKSAKKRNLVDFQGQMLLKGAHDNVIISIKGS